MRRTHFALWSTLTPAGLVVITTGVAIACGIGPSPATDCANVPHAPIPKEIETAIRAYQESTGHTAITGVDVVASPSSLPDDETDYTQWRAHGIVSMGAVAQLFMDANYVGSDTYWTGALDWMATRAQPQPEGGHAWPGWENATPYYEQIAKASTAWNAMAFAEGYLRVLAAGGSTAQADAYRDMADDAMVWLDAVKVPLSYFATWFPEYADAEGCVFFELFQHPHFYNIGSYGVAAVGRGAVEVFRATGSAEAENVVRCVAQSYLELAEDDGNGGLKWGVFSPMLSGYYGTSFCAGVSGIAEFLIEMAITWDDPEYEMLARSALKYLINMSEEVPESPYQPAYRWPGREDVAPGTETYSVITGNGAAGIGRAFLSAYEAWGDARYLEFVEGAANYVLHEGNTDTPAGTLDWTAHFDWTNWCVGHIGPMNFLGDAYDVTGDVNHGLGFLRAAQWLADQMIPFEVGRMFPSNISDPVANRTDMIWGFTGLTNLFYDSIPSLVYIEPALSMYVDALQWTEDAAAPEAGGLVWQFEYDLTGGGSGRSSLHETVARVADVVASARPNPSRATVAITTPADAARVDVFDVRGRLVRTLLDPPVGGAAWTWDGRNEIGGRVPQGTYFARPMDARGNPVTDRPIRVTILR